MLVDLQTRRRAVLLAYRRYLDADYAWSSTTERAYRWFPGERKAGIALLGNPGSDVRRLYRQREKAIQVLEISRQKLKVAQERLMQDSEREERDTLSITLFRA